VLATTTFATQTGADRFLAAQNRGAWVDPSTGQVSLERHAQAWLERRTDLRATTRSKYRHLLSKHILPALESTPLGRLQPSAVRAWYLALRGRHPATSEDAYRLLRAILSTAVTDGLVAVTPCKVRGPAPSALLSAPR